MFKNLLHIVIGSSLLYGCVRYAPRPIDAPALETSFRARSVSDPDLQNFFNATSTSKPQTWPPRTLDLEGLTILALYFSPDLDEARALIAASDAAIVTAGAKPNPNVAGAAGFTDAPESPYAFNFSLGVLFETAGKRQYRIVHAQQLSQAARFSLAETGWRLHSRLRASLIDHLISALELDQRTAEATIREEIVAIYQRRLEVGETSTPFVTAARTELARGQLELEQLLGRIDETRAAISGVIGFTSAALGNVQFSFIDLEKPPSEEALNIQLVQRLGLMNRLDVQRLLVEYAAAESDLRLQVARQYPDVALGPSYEFAEGDNRYTIVPGLALPVRNRNRGPIAEAEARRALGSARFLGAQAAAISEMERALADYRSALRELEQSQTTLRLVREREQATQRQLTAGEADRLALVSVRLEAAAADRARLSALRRAQSALGALEDALQHPLPAGVELPQPRPTNPREKKVSAPQ